MDILFIYNVRIKHMFSKKKKTQQTWQKYFITLDETGENYGETAV